MLDTKPGHAIALFALALGVALTASPARAQTAGTVTGRVFDVSEGQPLAGASIVLESDTGYRKATTTTGAGRYILVGIPAGRYRLRVELLSYRSLTIEKVVVRGGRRTEVDAEMRPAAIPLDPLIVDAPRVPLIEPEVSESRHILPGRELQALPVDQTEAAVELTPGVTDGHFRGGRIGQETYVVDGLAVKNQLEGSAQGLGLEYAPTSLEEVEVVTGGFAPEYGSALSGVVSYVTRRGDPDRWRARAAALTDQMMPDDVTRGFSQLSLSAGGPAAVLGQGSTVFADLYLQGMLDADPRARGLTCLRPDEVEPELAAGIRRLRDDPATAPLYCPYSEPMIPGQTGDRLIGFLRVDRPLSSRMNLTASVLRNRFQQQLYTPEFKYNPNYRLGQRFTGTLGLLIADWTRQGRGSGLHVTGRLGAARLDRHLGVIDPTWLADRFEVAGFGASDFRFLGEDFVRGDVNEQLRSGRAVPGYLPPETGLASPFGPAAEGFFSTEGTPPLANWTRSDLLAGDLEGELLLAEGHALEAGGSARFYRIESYERAFAHLPGSVLTYARFFPATVSGYAQARIAGGEEFQATLGLRVESFRSDLSFRPDRANFLAPEIDPGWKTAIMPRVGFAGAFRNSAGRTSFRFSYSQVAQPPDFRFFLDTTLGDSLRVDIRRQGNPDLSFERGRAFELAVSHLIGGVLGVTLTGFRKELTRLVTGSLQFADVATGQFSTGDRGTVQGIELSVRGRWRETEIRGGYSLQRAMGVGGGVFDPIDTVTVLEEFPLPFDRRHAADLMVLLGRTARGGDTPWGLAVTGQVQSGYPLLGPGSREDGGEIERLPWTAMVSARLTRELGDLPFCDRCRTRAVLDGRNLLWRENVIALRRDTGGVGPPPDAVLGAADRPPPVPTPIPRESESYSPAIDLDADGQIDETEFRQARIAAALDRNDPSLFFGAAPRLRLGLEVEF